MATVAQQVAAKRFGNSNGCKAGRDGIILAGSVPTEWKNWSDFYDAHKLTIADELTRQYTRYKAFSTLVKARGAIRLPEATVKRSYRCVALADAYDAYMREHGDSRRAVRG